MIFEEREFNRYCMGRSYEETLDIHLVNYAAILRGYESVFKKSMSEWLKSQSVLEAGCAMGHIIEELLNHGVECCGYEPSDYAINHALPSVKDRIIQADHNAALSSMTNDLYDIVYANSLQYSKNENDIRRWIQEICRICRHSLFFVSVTTQGLHRCITGSDVWKMQIIRPKEWWTDLFLSAGFKEVYWLNNIMCICLLQCV